MSALGGMTRLVSRRLSSSSPSLSSPPSQHSSPPTIPESQVHLTSPQEVQGSNAWQSYTHIQNLNVNINMGSNDYFSNNIPVSVSPDVPQEDMSILYQMPHMQQQQQQQMHQQLQHHHHHVQASMSMDMGQQSPSYYGSGYGPGYGNGNSNGYFMSHVGSMRTSPPHDLQDSWLNFMAPYKPGS